MARNHALPCPNGFVHLLHTPSLLACVSTTFRTGMNAEVSLKLLLLTMWVWMLRPSV